MVCNSNRCEETPISGGDGLETAVFADCCANAGDCDDGDEWTVDTCGEQQIAYGGALGESVTRMACLHELKKGAQCEIDAACDDSNDCTTDTCVQDATFGKRCQFMEISGCESCTSAEDCDDGDVCTMDTCTNQKCQYSGSVATSVQDGCCVSDEGCDTGDPCTPMACQNFQCVQLLELTTCCTSASDCDDNDDTTMNSCIDNSCDFNKSVPTEKFTSGTVATGPAQSAEAM